MHDRARRPPATAARPQRPVVPAGPPGALLGVFPAPEPHATTVELRPGDLLLLYTDGLTDHRGPRGLTEDRLVELLSTRPALAEQLASHVEAVLTRTASHADDDTAFLVVRVPPGADPAPPTG